MLNRGLDERFIREEGLNINIDNFTIIKYIIVLASIFALFKLFEKIEILNIDISCPARECSNECPIHECSPCICLVNATGKLG